MSPKGLINHERLHLLLQGPGPKQLPQPEQQLTGVGGYLRNLLSHNRTAQRVLLGLTLLMTAMVLGDGVLTPSISGDYISMPLL